MSTFTPEHRSPIPPRQLLHPLRGRMCLSAGAAFLAVLAWRRGLTLRATLKRLRHEATHDHLTGLPTRSLALDRLSRTGPNSSAERAFRAWPFGSDAGDGAAGLVGLLDLDGFKTVNDRHGHATGDRLLAAVGDRLVEALGQDGTAYRLSGDEFLLIWDGTPGDPLAAAGDVLAALGRPLTINGRTFEPAASLGLVHPRPGLTGGELIAAADDAMYLAKQRPDRSEGNDSAAVLYTGSGPLPAADRRTSQHRRLSTTPINAQPSGGYLETVGEVAAALARYEPDSPIMSALQPVHPKAGLILSILQTSTGAVWIATDIAEHLPHDARHALGW